MMSTSDAGSPRDLESEPIAGVMSQGVVSCAASMPLADVAARMESERIHCVLVHPDDATGTTRGWGVVSDLDLVGAADMPDVEAGAIAATPTVTVSTQDSIGRAARLMREYQTAHLLVLDEKGDPAGVISTLDVARAMARPG
jgi:CBS domain-containing protein